MSNNRVDKFKSYRASLSETHSFETPKELARSTPKCDTVSLTSTLPIDEVMKTSNDEKDNSILKNLKIKRIVKYCAIGLVFALLIVGIIVFAILAFGGN